MVPYRTGPIHVVGGPADKIFRKAIEEAKKDGHDEGWVNANRYYGTEEKWQQWLDPALNLTDDEGFITNLDGTPSPQVENAPSLMSIILTHTVALPRFDCFVTCLKVIYDRGDGDCDCSIWFNTLLTNTCFSVALCLILHCIQPLTQVHQFDRFGRPFDRWLNRRVKEWNAALDAKEK